MFVVCYPLGIALSLNLGMALPFGYCLFLLSFDSTLVGTPIRRSLLLAQAMHPSPEKAFPGLLVENLFS